MIVEESYQESCKKTVGPWWDAVWFHASTTNYKYHFYPETVKGEIIFAVFMFRFGDDFWKFLGM